MTEDELSAAQQGIELANRTIRYIAEKAREAPKIVAEELGLITKPTVYKDVPITMQLPHDTGVRLRVGPNYLALAEVRYRRWWQFWRPKTWTETVAEKPYSVKAGDTVQLMQQMRTYIVTVNNDEVLRYPPLQLRYPPIPEIP